MIMSEIIVKIGREEISIKTEVFLVLLDLPSIKERKAYKLAISSQKITLADLKMLAKKAYIPYPLFFASSENIKKQIDNSNKILFDKFPTKDEMHVGFRGSMKKENIELIIKDLARKQEFLKKRILISEIDNQFVGYISKMIVNEVVNKDIAEKVRKYFDIDLRQIRKFSKTDVLKYLCRKLEEKNILVSFSSYDFMPQNIDRNLGLSGICIKDKKFPYIFINTRDGDKKPLILETEGRKIFTLISMVVSIGMNKFMLSMKKGIKKDDSLKRVFSLTGEFLIPSEDLDSVVIKNIEDIKKYASLFKVTPSMFLVRLRESGVIGKSKIDQYKSELLNEIVSVKPGQKRSPLQINGYGKYNGEKFSHEVVRAYNSKKISPEEAKNILFRRGRVEQNLLQEYSSKYK